MIKNVYYFIVICCLLTKIKATTRVTRLDWKDEKSLIGESVTYEAFTEGVAIKLVNFTLELKDLETSLEGVGKFINHPMKYEIGDSKFDIELISYENRVPVYKIVEKGVIKSILKMKLCNKSEYYGDKFARSGSSNCQSVFHCICSYVNMSVHKLFKKWSNSKLYVFYYFEFFDIIKLDYSFCISDDKSLDEVKLKKLLKGVLEGIKELHWNGYLHGDIKLSNVLGYNNEEKESDEITYKLKCSSLTFKTCFIDPYLVKSQFYSRGYKSPEMLFRNENNVYELSTKSDIWAFGCLAYYLSIGRFSNITTVYHNSKVDLDKFEEFISRRVSYEEKLSPNLAKIILDCLKLNYEDRPTAFKLSDYSFFTENNDSNIK